MSYCVQTHITWTGMYLVQIYCFSIPCIFSIMPFKFSSLNLFYTCRRYWNIDLYQLTLTYSYLYDLYEYIVLAVFSMYSFSLCVYWYNVIDFCKVSDIAWVLWDIAEESLRPLIPVHKMYCNEFSVSKTRWQITLSNQKSILNKMSKHTLCAEQDSGTCPHCHC